MEIIRRILDTLEFQVDVFEGTDLDRPPAIVIQQRIAASDCIVVLLGPAQREPAGKDCEPAPWPAEEAVYAAGRERPFPLALILHPGTRIPNMMTSQQTPARFDFWDPAELLANIHHVMKHLLDLKRRIDLPLGDQPFRFTQASFRQRIQRGGSLVVDVYHEVVARQEWSRFHHALGTGIDRRQGAFMKLVNPEAYDIQATLNPGRHDVSIELQTVTDANITYFVDVNPPLLPGERLGYRREFEVNCYLPLTKEELLRISNEDGFPSYYKIDGKIYYGEETNVIYEMESIISAIHFPRKVSLISWRALAISMNSLTVNKRETERCNTDCLTLEVSPDSAERILLLKVPKPMFNHHYFLLYEPG